MSLVFGCCVGDQEKLARFVLPRLGSAPLIATYNQTSIARAYNQIIDGADWDMRDEDVLVLVHDDLEIVDPDAEGKLARAFADERVGIVGVAGGGSAHGIAWWEDRPVGRQRTDARLIDFGAREGEVDCLEGSLLALSGRVVQNMRFDEGYTGFHGYDADITMRIRREGLAARVIDLDTHHHTPEGFRSEASMRAWRAADARFRREWL